MSASESKTNNPRPKTAVVITTCDRLPLLAERSLPSVLAQTHKPDIIVVVDGSAAEGRAGNGEYVKSLNLPGCEISYLVNDRSESASGSWNTAIDFLVGEVDDPQQLFVAILDDDDSWAPTYLERCFNAVCARNLDMVAADLYRIEAVDGQPIPIEAPEQLCVDDFLTGNPGIQGSNLFVRLSVLLAAGGFDEEIKSTTDRDLCIRIAELGSIKYRRRAVPLVNHFAEPERARLSRRGSKVKIAGLTAFWRKYVGRMTEEQRRMFREHATRRFDWEPPHDAAAISLSAGRSAGNSINKSADNAADKSTRALVLGLVIEDAFPHEFLEAVQRLLRDETVVGLHIVLLERRGRDARAGAKDRAIAALRDAGAISDAGATSSVMDQVAASLRDAGAGCYRFSFERQCQDLEKGLFDDDFPKRERFSSRLCRDLLLDYCKRIAVKLAGADIRIAHNPKTGTQPPAGDHVDGILGWLWAAHEPVYEMRRRAAPKRNDASGPATKTAPTAAANLFDDWIQSERRVTAEHRIRSKFKPEKLRLLGHGSESVVFTDEHTVYKCIDYWKTRMPLTQIRFLQDNVGRWDYPGLYPLRKVTNEGTWTILTYDFEPSVPYEGGHESDLVRLMESCHAAGIVCNNIHPKNLVVTKANGVKLIDYGSEIRPWIPIGFELMARRMFLTCNHADHPQLETLMRRVLSTHRLDEMDGYPEFREKIKGDWGFNFSVPTPVAKIDKAPHHPPFALCVGVISSDPAMLGPFLRGIASLESVPCIKTVQTLVLYNGGPKSQMDAVIQDARRGGMNVAVIDEAQQRHDASGGASGDAFPGAFGTKYRERPDGQVEIARARTMLQRYLGALLSIDKGAIGWVLDDDMRVDGRAGAYLPWLPEYRARGVDVLLGAYEGYSPNPPLNGLRVQLVDILHNFHWLQGLDQSAVLPDRGAENTAQRARYPDYYYDLARGDTGHLETPHWLVPATMGETVREAGCRLQACAVGVLSGYPMTRPVIAQPPRKPLEATRDSVNRGGCTFIMDHRALSLTPNLITTVKDREARRSDMVWAIVNRHCRDMTVRAVQFPVNHLGRAQTTPDFNRKPNLNIDKLQSEIIGSSLYAAKTEFLLRHPHHSLEFSRDEAETVCGLANRHLERRLRNLEKCWHRIMGLREAIRQQAANGEFGDMLEYLDDMITWPKLEQIRSGVGTHDRGKVVDFLLSLRATADDYAAASVDIDFILFQLGLNKSAAAE